MLPTVTTVVRPSIQRTLKLALSLNSIDKLRTMSASAGPDRVMIGKDSVPPMAIGESSSPAMLNATGTWSWGDSMVWGHKDDDYEKIRESWNACNKQGLTFYDTA
jgi:hypothetical protein